MASLTKFTVVDPTGRVNLSLKQSTRVLIEQYLDFYKNEYNEVAERSELVGELLRAWFAQDEAFQAFLNRLTKADKAAYLKKVSTEPGAGAPAQA